jgi:long-chain acyl-CoA synthetase
VAADEPAGHGNLVDLLMRSAARFPNREALRMDDRRWTYAEALAEVERVAGGLRALGVQPGDRVAIFAENGPEYIIAYLAVAKLGAILATINPSFQQVEIAYIVANAEPRVALVQPALEERFRQCCRDASQPLPPLVRLGGPAGDGAVAYDELRRAAPLRDTAPTRLADGVLICYTSGSTARPKPVFRSHGGDLCIAYSHARQWAFGPEDRQLIALPMAWLFGLTTGTLGCLSAGGTAIFVPHFNPVVVLEQMERWRITVYLGVMTMYVKLLQVAESAGRAYDLSALRLCIAGGEPRNEAVAERFSARFGAPILDTYAASECCPIITYDVARDARPRPGSCGRRVPETEIRLVDPQGRDVPRGEVGELLARGPGLFLGYYREPELTAQVLRDGWFVSGDLLREDEDGYYYVVGRAKDLIIRGGANIAPAEVEAVIDAHPAVAEAAVVGVPDPVYGEQPKAFVVLRPGAALTADEVQAHCRARLAAYKVPAWVEFVPELPKGATGKVLKSALRGR